MKKALSFILLLSTATSVVAMDSLYNVIPKCSSIVKVCLKKSSGAFESAKNFDKISYIKSWSPNFSGFGANIFSKVSGLATGAFESAKNFDKDVFVEGCKQEPLKAFGAAVSVVLVSRMAYQVIGKPVYQNLRKRIEVNSFVKTLMVLADSTDKEFDLESITAVAPGFLLKHQDNTLKLAIKDFMIDREKPFLSKGLISLVNEFRAADNKDKETIKMQIITKIELMKEHILDSAY